MKRLWQPAHRNDIQLPRVRRPFHAGERGRQMSFGSGATLATPPQSETPQRQPTAGAGLPCPACYSAPPPPQPTSQMWGLREGLHWLNTSWDAVSWSVYVHLGWSCWRTRQPHSPPPCPLCLVCFSASSPPPHHGSLTPGLVWPYRSCVKEPRKLTLQGDQKYFGQHSCLNKGHSRRAAQRRGLEGTGPPESSPLLDEGICTISWTPLAFHWRCPLLMMHIACAESRGETQTLSLHLGVASPSSFLYK